MRSNFHTHSTWCDGRNSVEEMIAGAIDRKFSAIGFTSHVMLPYYESWTLGPTSAKEYVADIRAAAKKYEKYIKVFCGMEADYIRGVTTPDRSRYAEFGLDYLIGSLHTVASKAAMDLLAAGNEMIEGDVSGSCPNSGKHLSPAFVAVDNSPEILANGIRDYFHGSARELITAYHEQFREMVSRFDFDIIGHPDLYRKYNLKHPFFDESEGWYREELVKTADVIAASGKLVEVNTGAIGRNWRDDAYPSDEFRSLLRERGVKFLLNSDSHSVDSLDAGFSKYSSAESYIDFSSLLSSKI